MYSDLITSLRVRGHRRRQTIPMWNSSRGGGGNSSGHHCLSGVRGIGHYVTTWLFSNCEQGSHTCLFNRHCSTMNLVKEKQGGLVPSGLKRLPFKLIKHFSDTTRFSPSPAGPSELLSI